MSFSFQRCYPSSNESSCNGVDDTSKMIKGFFLPFSRLASASMSLNIRVVTTIFLFSFVLILSIVVVRPIGLRLVDKIL